MRLTPAALCLLGLAACRADPHANAGLPDADHLLGPSYARSEERSGAAEGAQAPALDEVELDAARWWERYSDPVTAELVERALEANLDLTAAAARVLDAEARARSAFGSRLPSVDVAARGSRNLIVLPDLGSGSTQRLYVEDYRLFGTLSWQLDLFGRLRAAERQSVAEWMANENDRVGLAHSVVALVLRNRVALSVALRRLELARGVVDSRRQTLEIVEGRYGRGVEAVSAVDVRLARENLAAAQAVLPDLQLGLETTAHALDELLGRRPGLTLADDAYVAGLAAELPAPEAPPTGMPARLLDRRPDLRAAAFRTTAAQADVDVAVASLWPDLVLTFTGGYSGNRFEDLIRSDNLFDTLVGDLAVRLFSGGSLRANIDAAEARLAAQAAEYLAAVLAAVREVEDALASERRLGERLTLVRTQRDEAIAAEELARDRYRRGLESLLTVLETERRRSAAQDLALVLTEATWNARIDLHLALGGDWALDEEDGDEVARTTP